jgi:hypothetical protein
MCKKKTFSFRLLVTIAGFTILLLPLFAVTPAHAQTPDGDVDNGTCISCHEDLYFLHDTGNWFCIRESPMPCVYCHGGDPTATTQEMAHYDRSAHPIVNEDISRCQECHVDPDECCECVTKFKDVAGLKQVKLVSPAPLTTAPDTAPGLPAVEAQGPVDWPLILDILPFLVVASLALTIYILYKVRHA